MWLDDVVVLDPDFEKQVIEPLKQEAEKREKAGKGEDGSGGRGNKKNPVQESAQGLEPSKPNHPEETRTTIAKAHGTNHKAVAQAEKILAEHPEKAAEIREIYDRQAKERQKEHGGTAPGKEKNTGGKFATSDSGKARDKAGEAASSLCTSMSRRLLLAPDRSYVGPIGLAARRPMRTRWGQQWGSHTRSRIPIIRSTARRRPRIFFGGMLGASTYNLLAKGSHFEGIARYGQNLHCPPRSWSCHSRYRPRAHVRPGDYPADCRFPRGDLPPVPTCV